MEELSSSLPALTNPRDLVEVEEKTRIKENKNGVSRMGLDEIIGLIGGSEPCYIIVLVALLGLAGRNRLHSFIRSMSWNGATNVTS